MIALLLPTALIALGQMPQDAPATQENGATPNITVYEFCLSQVGRAGLTKEDCEPDPSLLPYVPVCCGPSSPEYLPGPAAPSGPVPHSTGRHVPCAATGSVRRVSVADMRVAFENDSAHLNCEAQAVLWRFAIAIQSRGTAPQRFRIVGHTSATGSAAYNQRLSKRRADAVVRFLVALHVDRSRLLPEGVGFTDPLPRLPARHHDNRRVEAVMIE